MPDTTQGPGSFVQLLPVLTSSEPPIAATDRRTTSAPPDSRECSHTIPDFAYVWRPFANPEMIYKQIDTPRGPGTFIIDPWTQRWLIAFEPVPSFLRLADGRRRLSEIIRLLSVRTDLSVPSAGYDSLAAELGSLGVLFDTHEQHHRTGLPIYNSCSPIGMHLEITNACNMTCSHCYVSSGHKLPNELSLEEIFKIIDMLPPFSGKRIAISGGEPAVRRDCADILAYCISGTVTTWTFTQMGSIFLITSRRPFSISTSARLVASEFNSVSKVRHQKRTTQCAVLVLLPPRWRVLADSKLTDWLGPLCCLCASPNRICTMSTL